MTPLASSQSPAPSQSLPADKPEVTQSTIVKSFDGLLLAMRETPADVPKLRRMLLTVFGEIHAAKDADHVSALFGSGATLRDDNICVLQTLIDSGNISDESKAELKTLLKEKCAELSGAGGSSLDKILRIQEQVLADGAAALKGKPTSVAAAQSVTTPISKLTVEGREFTIEKTTAGSRDGVHGANDCLAYSLQADNAPLAENYRATVFSQPNIEAQLARMLAQTESGGAARHGDAPAFQAVCAAVMENYPGARELATAANVRELSTALAQHIQTSGCMLDGDVAGGVFAARLGQPIVVVSQRASGNSYNVFDAVGTPIFKGSRIGDVDNNLLDGAKFIHLKNGNHFERMLPVVA